MNKFSELIYPLEEVIKKLERIRELCSDKWNVDDEICKQNMKKIKEIFSEEN